MRWTNDKIQLLQKCLDKDMHMNEISEIFNCSNTAIYSKIHRLGLQKFKPAINIVKNCLNCNNEFTVKKSSDIKYNHTFCSRSCSATYNNKGRTVSDKTRQKISKTLSKPKKDKPKKEKLKQIKKYCLYCNTELSKTAKKYCNTSCKAKYERSIIIKQWLNGKILGHYNNPSYTLRPAIKQYVHEQANYKCEECDNNNKNTHTGNLILQIDHIDGDASNSIPSNLRLLCPNCHAMTKTFLNVGGYKSARYKYRSNYYNSRKN